MSSRPIAAVFPAKIDRVAVRQSNAGEIMEIAGVVRGLITVAAIGLLSGCIAQVPDDLALVSVEAVDWHDEAELAGQGTEQHRLLLKVQLVSNTDLLRFVQRHSYSLRAKASFCDQAEEQVLLAYPPIFWHGMRLDPYDSTRTELTRDSNDAPITYYVYLGTEDTGSIWPPPPWNPTYRAYNLVKAPRDICLTVSGGSMSGFGYRSNPVIISTTEITAALSHRPPAFQ